MISVIIPVYNVEKQLPDMICCLRKQTFSDFEVILINDGSKDDSGSVCDKIAAEDPRFRVIHQANAGVSSARNCGLVEAKGDYIAFVDGDDIIDDNYLEAMYQAIVKYNADMAVCDVSVECGEKVRNTFSYPAEVISAYDALAEILKREKINSGPCAKMFHKTSLPRDLKFPAQKTYEDVLFIADALLAMKSVVSVNNTAYHYINNPNGAMGSFNKMPTVDIVHATDRLMQIAIAEKLPPQCIYVTLSHLMQNVQMLDRKAAEMLSLSRRLYRKYLLNIWKCDAFPWKEKIVFSMFAFGIRRFI